MGFWLRVGFWVVPWVAGGFQLGLDGCGLGRVVVLGLSCRHKDPGFRWLVWFAGAGRSGFKFGLGLEFASGVARVLLGPNGT